MATIPTNTQEAIFKINKFLGINENPDGDTKLKNGEASRCINWKVTRDGNLKRRPGTRTMLDLGTGKPVVGIWCGTIKGQRMALAASDGKLFRFWKDTGKAFPDGVHKEELGPIETDNEVSFFPFSGIVYILNGTEYYQYDGTTFDYVRGYAPLVIVARNPNGTDGSLLEEVNKLNGLRRVWFSPDGTSSVYRLPETDLITIDYAKNNATGELFPRGMYSVDPYHGTLTFGGKENFKGNGTTKDFVLQHQYVTAVTVKVNGTSTTAFTFTAATRKVSFQTAPANNAAIEITETIVPSRDLGTSGIEICYTASAQYRHQVCRMRYAELYSGTQDTRVFIYGDGSNEAFYSSIDYDGVPRADYFPDLNEMAIGDSNSPITGLIRHYSQLLCYKENSAWAIQYGLITLADGNTEAAFYSKPVNKVIGNEALGQVRLIENTPYTFSGNDIYEWKNTSAYSSNLTIDERQAKRCSDRIYNSLSQMDFSKIRTFDDNLNKEYYVFSDNIALVYNVVSNAWYKYTDFNASAMCNIEEEVIAGTTDGKIKWVSELFTNDDGKAFESFWISGSIDYGKSYMQKMMSQMWVTIKPESAARVWVTVQTDKKIQHREKVVSSSLAGFSNMNFEAFSFVINRKPHSKRLKIKAKKFAFMNIIFETDDAQSSATILGADARIRFTSYVK